jgi:hypothetical protein
MEFLKQFHSDWRWILLLVALITVVKAFFGWLRNRSWEKLDDRLGMAFTIAVDIQVLIGLVIWFGSGWAKLIPQAMSDSTLRFIAVEHPVLMLIGLGIAHFGRIRSRKASTSATQHRAAAIFYLLSLLVILAAIPWSRLFS